MPRVVFVHPDGRRQVVAARIGDSVMHTAVHAGVKGIVGECGGSQACATCHVYVDPDWASLLPSMQPHEDAMLECTASARRATSRLSCQLKLDAQSDGLIVEIPPAQY